MHFLTVVNTVYSKGASYPFPPAEKALSYVPEDRSKFGLVHKYRHARDVSLLLSATAACLRPTHFYTFAQTERY